jgi:hypothetical protein
LGQYNTLKSRTGLSAIAASAQTQNIKVDNISSIIQEPAKQQAMMPETGSDNNYLPSLCINDPYNDKKRIEQIKGGQLEKFVPLNP